MPWEAQPSPSSPIWETSCHDGDWLRWLLVVRDLEPPASNAPAALLARYQALQELQDAMRRLGWEGELPLSDRLAAVKGLERAAELGDAQSARIVASCHYTAFLAPRVRLLPYPRQGRLMRCDYLSEGWSQVDSEQARRRAVPWLIRSGETGDADGFLLAGTLSEDAEERLRLFRRAAAAGDEHGMWCLAFALRERGERDAAREWERRADRLFGTGLR